MGLSRLKQDVWSPYLGVALRDVQNGQTNGTRRLWEETYNNNNKIEMFLDILDIIYLKKKKIVLSNIFWGRGG